MKHLPPVVPKFLFKDAIVLVDGIESVVSDVKISNRKNGKKLVVHFNDGAKRDLDASKIQQPAGVLPDFIFKDARVMLVDHKGEPRGGMGGGYRCWNVEGYFFTKTKGSKTVDLHLELTGKIAGMGVRFTTLFNAVTVQRVIDIDGARRPVRVLRKIKLTSPS